MAFKNKETKKQANKIAWIRDKQKKGKRLTQLEQSELAAWDRAHPRKRTRPPADPLTSGGAEQPVPVEKDTVKPVAARPVEVQSTLPGAGGNSEGPPPLTVGAEGAGQTVGTQPQNAASSAGSSGPSAGGGHSASSAPTNGEAPKIGIGHIAGKKPAMSEEEARRQVDALAGYMTQILSELNQFNMKNGRPGVPDQFLKLFHFSLTRLGSKVGVSMDEDTFDGVVVVGTGGFIGFQTYMVRKEQKEKEKAIEMPVSAPQPITEKKDNGKGASPGSIRDAGNVAPNGSGLRVRGSDTLKPIPGGKGSERTPEPGSV